MNEPGSRPTVLDLLNKSASYLAARGSSSPRLDAEVLLADILGCTRIQLYVGFDRGLDEKAVDLYRQAIVRRGKREPVAYITGRKEFMGRDLSVSREVLVPRPETELMAEAAVEAAKGLRKPLIAELCCGTGAAGIHLAISVPEARVVLTDISEGALEVAKGNVAQYGLSERVGLYQGDLFDALPEDLSGKFDVIMANPPYIMSSEIEGLEPEVSVHEPRLALDGGPDGLDFYRKISARASLWIKPGGTLVMEIGSRQAEAVTSMLSAAGFRDVSVMKDLAGLDRVVLATA